MTGFSALLPGTGQNIVYSPGLVRRRYFGYAGTDTDWFLTQSPYNTTIQTAPITDSFNTSASISVEWTGYIRPSVNGTNTFTLLSFINDANSFSCIWVGSVAKSGYNIGNILTSSNGTGAISLIAGQYYAIRVQYSFDGDSGFFNDPDGSLTLLVNSNTSYPVFYNSLTQGF